MKNDIKTAGAWDYEPNELAFESSGLPCKILRGHHGALCGYVRLPERHPWLVGDIDTAGIGVHGGITFGPAEFPGMDGIWIGFDCAHSGDLCPKYGAQKGDVYRDIEYVRGEVASLARQAIDANTKEVLCERAIGHLPQWVIDDLHLEWW